MMSDQDGVRAAFRENTGLFENLSQHGRQRGLSQNLCYPEPQNHPIFFSQKAGGSPFGKKS